VKNIQVIIQFTCRFFRRTTLAQN